MIGKLFSLASVIALVGYGVMSDTIKLSAVANPPTIPLEQMSKIEDNILLSTPTNKGGRLIKIEAIISEPQDIKVNPGQAIRAGDIIADRTSERNQLEFQKQQLQASLSQLNSYRIDEPTPPGEAPIIPSLPEADYSVFIAEINKAKLRVELVSKQAGLLGATSGIAPETVRADIEDKSQKLAEAERLLELQEKKLQAVNDIGLPSYYAEHEEIKTAEARQAVELAKSDLATSEAKSNDAVAVGQQKLQEVYIQLELAEADLRLAESSLLKAKSEREKEEYNHTLTLARRIEESNQAKSFYEQERNKVQDSKRDLEYKKASIVSQINQVEEKLRAIAVVKAPFNGEIRRVKINGQTNNNLSATISIVTSDPGASGNNGTQSENPFDN